MFSQNISMSLLVARQLYIHIDIHTYEHVYVHMYVCSILTQSALGFSFSFSSLALGNKKSVYIYLYVHIYIYMYSCMCTYISIIILFFVLAACFTAARRRCRLLLSFASFSRTFDWSAKKRGFFLCDFWNLLVFYDNIHLCTLCVGNLWGSDQSRKIELKFIANAKKLLI